MQNSIKYSNGWGMAKDRTYLFILQIPIATDQSVFGIKCTLAAESITAWIMLCLWEKKSLRCSSNYFSKWPWKLSDDNIAYYKSLLFTHYMLSVSHDEGDMQPEWDEGTTSLSPTQSFGGRLCPNLPPPYNTQPPQKHQTINQPHNLPLPQPQVFCIHISNIHRTAILPWRFMQLHQPTLQSWSLSLP